MQQASSYHTPALAGFGLAFSPFVTNRIALASSTNFGLVGNGRVSVLSDHGPAQGIQLEQQFETRDAVHAVAWSELNPNHVASGGGDGSVKLWDITLPRRPVAHWLEHKREVMSVDWNSLRKEQFASSSWDGTVKLWSPERKDSLATIAAHDACVYSTSFSPHVPYLIGSCSGSGHLALHDTRLPTGSPPQILFAPFAPGIEALSFDFNKYDQGVIALSGTDKSIRVCDLRHNGRETTRAVGHAFPARAVKWSPWKRHIFASAGYDMSCRIWSMASGTGATQIAQHGKHTEFVCGLAWSLFDDGLLMSCGWDGMIHSWRPPM